MKQTNIDKIIMEEFNLNFKLQYPNGLKGIYSTGYMFDENHVFFTILVPKELVK